MLISEDTYDPGFPFTHKHFNTFFKRMYLKAPEKYNRIRMVTRDGDFIDLDESFSGNDKLVILVHGLEGSSRSEYIKTAASHLNENGFDCIAINQRGCSGEDNLKPYAYHSGVTADLEDILLFVEKNYSYKKLFFVGYSLGGNQILKFLGEQGSNAAKTIAAAVSVSVPVDLAGSSKQLDLPGTRFYTQLFLKSLKEKSLEKLRKFPDSGLDRTKILGCKNFYDFDNAVTATVFGFKNASDYYEKSSSKTYLQEIKVPTLLLNAQDDPFLSASCYPANELKSHKYLFFWKTQYGGHVGFNSSFIPRKNLWLESEILQFIQKTG